MRPIGDSPTETTIDRDFDQTAPHVHAKDRECPTCNSVTGFHEPNLYKMPEFAGPAGSDNARWCLNCNGTLTCESDCPGYEFPESFKTLERISDLQKENQNVRELYEQACTDRDAAQMRVKQFERFTDILANHLDALMKISNPAEPRSEFPKAA